MRKETLDELQRRLKRVTELVDERQDGLFMWQGAVNQEMNNLVEWWALPEEIV